MNTADVADVYQDLLRMEPALDHVEVDRLQKLSELEHLEAQWEDFGQAYREMCKAFGEELRKNADTSLLRNYWEQGCRRLYRIYHLKRLLGASDAKHLNSAHESLDKFANDIKQAMQHLADGWISHLPPPPLERGNTAFFDQLRMSDDELSTFKNMMEIHKEKGLSHQAQMDFDALNEMADDLMELICVSLENLVK